MSTTQQQKQVLTYTGEDLLDDKLDFHQYAVGLASAAGAQHLLKAFGGSSIWACKGLVLVLHGGSTSHAPTVSRALNSILRPGSISFFSRRSGGTNSKIDRADRSDWMYSHQTPG